MTQGEGVTQCLAVCGTGKASRECSMGSDVTVVRETPLVPMTAAVVEVVRGGVVRIPARVPVGINRFGGIATSNNKKSRREVSKNPGVPPRWVRDVTEDDGNERQFNPFARKDVFPSKVYCLPLLGTGDNLEMKITGKVGGVSMRMLVDTGSMISLINIGHSRLWQKWGRSSDVKVRLADGTSVSVGREGDVQMTIGGRDMEHRVIEMGIEEDVILGMDFLSKFGVDISTGKKTLNFTKLGFEIGVGLGVQCHSDTSGGRQSGATQEGAREVALREVLPEPVPGLVMEVTEIVKVPGGVITELIAKVKLKFANVFSGPSSALGKTAMVQHRIVTGETIPIKQRPRGLPYHRRKVAEDEITKMLQLGVIEKSESPWCSPVVLVTKKDGEVRFCVDYRKLNEVTVKDSYPLPNLTEMLEQMGGSDWFSVLDLKSGYWQIPMVGADKEKTAFSIGRGLWQFTVMPFGLCNAVATFQRVMERVLAGLLGSCCLVYVDDVIVFGETLETGVINLEKVLSRLQSAGMVLADKKCHFLEREVKFLGHLISGEGLRMDPEKQKCVKEWPEPSNIRELRGFLGFATYYRRFIRGYSDLVEPLNRLLRKEGDFVFGGDQKAAMRNIVSKLTGDVMLNHPVMEKEFILDTDASDVGIGAVLSQEIEGKERVIAFYSKTLSQAERNYCVTRKELLAVVKGMKNFRDFLLGCRFRVRTDHSALKWLTQFKEPEGQIARWLEQIQNFEFVIEHRPGSRHGNADGLSRRPCMSEECRACEKKESRWGIRSVTTDLGWGQVQDADSGLKVLMEKLREHVERPSKAEMGAMSFEVGILWRQWDSLRLREGVLYRKREKSGVLNWQLVVPRLKRLDVLEELHAGRTAGHFGEERTFRSVQKRFYWPGYHRSVEVFCAGCLPCLSRKHPGKASVPILGFRVVGYPFERIAIDVMGPLKRSDQGNRYVLVVGDYFTKWIEAYPLPNQEATTIATVLCQEFFCRYGVPVEIHSDQGRNFESVLIKEVWDLMGVKKTRTTPFRPQSDGMIERFNRTLAEILSKRVDVRQNDWDVHLPYAMLAYRTSVHSATGFSPAEILLGYKVKLPLDLLMPRTDDGQRNYGEFARVHQDRLQSVREKVRWNLVEVGRKMKDRFDQMANLEVLVEGDAVWMKYSLRTKGLSPKLQAKWEGPYTVQMVLSEQLVKIARRGKLITVHRSRVKKVRSFV